MQSKSIWKTEKRGKTFVVWVFKQYWLNLHHSIVFTLPSQKVSSLFVRFGIWKNFIVYCLVHLLDMFFRVQGKDLDIWQSPNLIFNTCLCKKQWVNSQKLQNCAAIFFLFLLDEFFYSSTTVEDGRKQKKFKFLL